MDRDRVQLIRSSVSTVAFLLMCGALILSTFMRMDDKAESDKWFKANMRCIDEFREYARTGVIPDRLRR